MKTSKNRRWQTVRSMGLASLLSLWAGLALAADADPTDAGAGGDLSFGYVQSLHLTDDAQPGDYFLLTQNGTPMGPIAVQLAEAVVMRALTLRGYGERRDRMADADMILVLRMGAQPDRPSIDDVLERGVDPDVPLDRGQRFVRVDAYDLAGLAGFLKAQGDAASVDAGADFLRWQTLAVSHGALSGFTAVLPTMLAGMSSHLGTNMTAAVALPAPSP